MRGTLRGDVAVVCHTLILFPDAALIIHRLLLDGVGSDTAVGIVQPVQWDTAVPNLETRVLAYQIDHFCPWTGTLIARDNMPYFQAFTGSLLCACIGVGAICVIGLTMAVSNTPI